MTALRPITGRMHERSPEETQDFRCDLTQPFSVVRTTASPVVMYEELTGGGEDAEIGPYTRIRCAVCRRFIYADPAFQHLAEREDRHG